METGTLISCVAMLVALLGLILNSRKDTRQDAAANAIIQTKLDSLITGVDDIRVEMRTMRDTIGDHGERLARVEARAQSNTHRLDAIEEGSRVTQRAILALLSHGIDGNDIDAMKAAKKELQEYLIER